MTGEPPAPREPSTDQWRTYFAAERTLLAWVRTGLALMGFGFLLERFGLFLRQVAEMRSEVPSHHRISAWFGVTLVTIGAVVLVVAARQHARTLARFAAGTDLGRPSASAAPLALTVVLAAFGFALAVYLIAVR